jgi:hypothetical protein
MTAVAFGIWTVVGLVVALASRRALTVYWVSCLLGVIPVLVAQQEYGLLPMAGVFHVLLMGFYPCAVWWMAKIVRAKRNS